MVTLKKWVSIKVALRISELLITSNKQNIINVKLNEIYFSHLCKPLYHNFWWTLLEEFNKFRNVILYKKQFMNTVCYVSLNKLLMWLN